eukprot:scaffold245469_cov44-Prasinocladus_malaysianus.AAC.1
MLCMVSQEVEAKAKEFCTHRQEENAGQSAGATADLPPPIGGVDPLELDPLAIALKRRQESLGLFEGPAKQGLTPSWVVALVVDVFGLTVTGLEPYLKPLEPNKPAEATTTMPAHSQPMSPSSLSSSSLQSRNTQQKLTTLPDTNASIIPSATENSAKVQATQSAASKSLLLP